MKKMIMLSLIISVLFSIVALPVGAAEDALWIPVRSSKVSAEAQYPLYPTHRKTDDGRQFIFPEYPNDIAPTTAMGSGLAYNKKVDIDGFSLELRVDDITTPSTSNYIAFAFSDSVNLPFWGANGNAAHVMFQPLSDGSYWFRAYINKDGAQTKVAETKYTNANVWEKGFTFKLTVEKKDSGYMMNINGNEFSYAFTELSGILPDGKFNPVFCMYSNDMAEQKMKFTVLKMGDEIVGNSSNTSSTTTAPTGTTAAPTTTTAPSTFDGIYAVYALVIIGFAGIVTVRKFRRVDKMR